MRIGGAFPFSVSDPAFGGGIVTLASGGVYYPPAGNYLYTAGDVTALQTFDPVGQQWRGFGQPNYGAQPLEVDGYNWRLINLSGTITGALITNAGSGATNGIGSTATGVTIAFGAPTAPGITATAYPIVGGAIIAPTVAQAGTGFVVPPDVIIDPPPPGGTQATAIATLSAGGVASIVMVNPGAGYLVAPNFYLVPQNGVYTGATVAGQYGPGAIPPPGQVNVASALPGYTPAYTGSSGALLNPSTLTGSGTLTGIGMLVYGSLYTGTTIPAVTITGCGAATATALPFLVLTGFTSLVAGVGYGAGAGPIFETSLGVVSLTANGNNFSPRAARGVGALSGGGVASLAIEDQGFGFQKVPVVSIVNTSAAATTQATAVAVVGGVNDSSLLQTRITT
jgi:hypothetical protein